MTKNVLSNMFVNNNNGISYVIFQVVLGFSVKGTILYGNLIYLLLSALI